MVGQLFRRDRRFLGGLRTLPGRLAGLLGILLFEPPPVPKPGHGVFVQVGMLPRLPLKLIPGLGPDVLALPLAYLSGGAGTDAPLDHPHRPPDGGLPGQFYPVARLHAHVLALGFVDFPMHKAMHGMSGGPAHGLDRAGTFGRLLSGEAALGLLQLRAGLFCPAPRLLEAPRLPRRARIGGPTPAVGRGFAVLTKPLRGSGLFALLPVLRANLARSGPGLIPSGVHWPCPPGGW